MTFGDYILAAVLFVLCFGWIIHYAWDTEFREIFKSKH